MGQDDSGELGNSDPFNDPEPEPVPGDSGGSPLSPLEEEKPSFTTPEPPSSEEPAFVSGEIAETSEFSAPPEPPEPPEPPKPVGRLEVYFPSSRMEGRRAIYVASFPPIIYFWPSMITFWVCGVMQYFEWVNPGILGWVTICVFALNVLVTVQDFDQKKFLILVLVIAVLVLLAWIINMKGYQFLKDALNWLRDLNPTLSTSAFIIFGMVFGAMMGWGLLRPLFDYWRIEHNEFVHYIQPFGRDMSIPRAGSTVSKQIPDILEFILTLGGGSLVIKREGRTWAVIPHIPFLGIRMKVIEKMLSETRVTTIDP